MIGLQGNNAGKVIPSILGGSAVSVMLFLVGCIGGGSDSGSAKSEESASEESAQILDFSPRASLIVDVNNDGLQDIVLDTDQSERARDLLLLNVGDYTFERREQAFPERYAGSDGITVAFNSGYFNGDSHIDIIAITTESYTTSKVKIYLGDGNGQFSDSGDVVTGPGFSEDNTLNGWPEWVRVADFDGDGYDDFILTTSGSCADFCNRLYLNDGSNSFSPAQITFDDGVNDYTSNTLEWEIDADPEPSVPEGRRDDLFGDVFLGDLNNDGKMDLFSPASFSQVAMATFINRSSSPGDVRFDVRFSKASGDIYSDDQPQIKNGVLADINNDGLLDVVGSRSIASALSEDSLPVLGFLNQGDGTMNLDQNIVSDDVSVVHARQWLAINADGAGATEVFVADHGTDSTPFPGIQNVFLSYQDDSLVEDVVASRLSSVNSYTHGASAGDLNGDGNPDLFLNNSKPGSVEAVPEGRFWINDGEGNFTAQNPSIR